MLLSSARAREAFERAREELERLERSNFADREVRAVQSAKSKRLWDRLKQVPFYEGLVESETRRLGSLPLTPKSLVKTRPDLFFARTTDTPLKYYETSGTSGTPTPTPRLAEDVINNTLSVAACWKRVLRRGDRVAMLLPSDLSPIGDLISNVCEYLQVQLVRCYPFALGICDWDRLERMFSRYRPTCLFAAPGVIVQFMRLSKRRRSFAAVRDSVEKIMLLGEVSTPGLRKMLADEWRTETYDASYGGTETGTIAATCERGSLHALTHAFVLEIDDGRAIGPLRPGSRGELVVTTLNNHARPLLRYASGDLVEVSDGASCACDLHLPVLRVLGRKEETVRVKGVPLNVEAVESIVYGVSGITGYMIEVDGADERARLLLEKDVDLADGQGKIGELQRAFSERGIVWDGMVLLNELPSITKSGAGQKNWKKTNVRTVSSVG